MIGDESWILYENNIRTAFWIARGSEPLEVAKPDLHSRKVLLYYWWDTLLRIAATVTASTYTHQLENLVKIGLDV